MIQRQPDGMGAPNLEQPHEQAEVLSIGLVRAGNEQLQGYNACLNPRTVTIFFLLKLINISDF